MKILTSLLTKNLTEIPLFRVDFNLNKFRKGKIRNTCLLKLHPKFKEDQYIKKTLNDLVDYIRDEYDMEDVV